MTTESKNYGDRVCNSCKGDVEVVAYNLWGISANGNTSGLQPEIESSILSISTINIKDSMIIKPLKKKILVAENKSETKSESGIILDNATSVRESKRATVLAIGPDVTLVKEGDVVLLEWTKGTVVKVDDAQRVMIDEEFVVAVFD